MIGRGRIIAAGPAQQVIDSVSGAAVRVRCPRATELAELAELVAADGAVATSKPGGGVARGSGVGTGREAAGRVAAALET